MQNIIRWMLLLVFVVGSVPAAVFQYHLPITYTHKDKQRTARALIWLPAEAAQIRGMFVAANTSAEASVVRDAQIRAVCAEAGFGILFIGSSMSRVSVPDLLQQAAEVSGYSEIAHAPFVTFGHSAGGAPALNQAIRFSERVVAVIQYRGGMPSKGTKVQPGTPTLAMMGEFDEFWGTQREADGRESWNRAQQYIAGFRAESEQNLGCFVAEPGTGHFPWSEKNSNYLSLWLKKILAARVPTDWDGTQPPKLIALQAEDGWLTGFDLNGPAACHAFSDYPGDKTATSWHIDEEMARATLAYHEGIDGLQDQFIRWKDKVWVDAGVRNFFTGPKWVGGARWQPQPVFANKVPAQLNGQGPKWPGGGEAAAGNNGKPISLQILTGPARVAEDGTLELAFDAIYRNFSTKIVFVAKAPAGDGYRATETIGMLTRGFKGLGKGAKQQIDFPAINVAPGQTRIPLAATSDQGLPVEYFVAYGPGTIRDGALIIEQIPAKATKPIDLRVIAYQMGSAVEPQVKTAAPVGHTITITR